MSKLKKHDKNSFKCINCKKQVDSSEYIGTKNRNHCPFCLYSQHLDLKTPGDRKSYCRAKMEPIGLTFKQKGYDKYGNWENGEIMIIHRCTNDLCNKTSINRIAADDSTDVIMAVFKDSFDMNDELKQQIESLGIKILTEVDMDSVMTQLFGKQK